MRRIKMILASCIIFFAGAASSFATEAQILIDTSSRHILEASNADVQIGPASLTKMMTLYLTFEALGKGRLRWDEQIPISRNAAGTVPYKLGIPAGGTISVREAVSGIIVISANDAAIALGERLGGSESGFAALMNAKARQLNMKATTFKTATGLTAAGQLTTARDMAVLGMALMQHFPAQFSLFSMKTTEFRGKVLKGHNFVMDMYPGVDGMKTGYTSASGYNLVTSVKKGNRRYVAVVLGYPTDKQRDQQMVQLLQRNLEGLANTPAPSAPRIQGAVGLY